MPVMDFPCFPASRSVMIDLRVWSTSDRGYKAARRVDDDVDLDSEHPSQLFMSQTYNAAG